MATDIVSGLFGVTPESYQAQRDQAAQMQAMKYAEMDPFQQANYGMFLGGNRLAGAAGQALGAQDPQLQKISAINALSRQFDTTTPEGMAGMANALKSTYPDVALQLSQQAQAMKTANVEMSLKQAQAVKALREKEGADPIQQLLRAGKFTTPSIATYQRTGKIEDLENIDVNDPTVVQETSEGIGLYNKKTGELIKTIGQPVPKETTTPSFGADAERSARELFGKGYKDLSQEQVAQVNEKLAIKPAPAFGADAERFSRELFGKGYEQLTQPEMAKVNAKIESSSKGKTNITFSPEIKMTNQELEWRKQYLGENKPVIEQGSNVRQALNLLNQSQTSPFADAAFANTVVSAFGGDKQKSKSEIDRLVKSGSLDERIANTLTGFFEGTTSAKTKIDQAKVLQAVDKALEARYNSASSGWKSRLEKAKVDPSLVIPDYSSVVGASKTPSALPPEGTRLRNKSTGKIEVVKNGKLVPEGQ